MKKQRYSISVKPFCPRSMLVRNALRMRKTPTPDETALHAHTQYITKLPIVVQYPIRGIQKIGYILDIAIPSLKIGIEIDGSYHLDDVQRANDAFRSQELNSCGWIILRVTSASCFHDAKTVAKALANAIYGVQHGYCDPFYDGLVTIDWHPVQMPGPKPLQENKPIRVIPSRDPLPKGRR